MEMATNDIQNRLLDKSCDSLRQLFKKLWLEKYGQEWTMDKANLDILSKQMRKTGKLHLQFTTDDDIDKWDMTRLCACLTNKNLLFMSAAEKNNVNRLNRLCNEVFYNANKAFTDDELNQHWREVTSILVQFGESEDDLKLLKQEGQFGGIGILKKEEVINDVNTNGTRQLKNDGNAEFEKGNWAKSVELYTQALQLHRIPPTDRAVLYSNRCIAFLKQNDLHCALEDGKKTTELRPEWWRGHFRLGQVYRDMKKYKEAENCLDEAFAREPSKKEITDELSYVRLMKTLHDGEDFLYARIRSKSWEDCVADFNQGTGSAIDFSVFQKLAEKETVSAREVFLNMEDCRRGVCCESGSGGFPKDYKVAAQYYKKAADRGSAEGSYFLALLHMEGKGVKRDFQLAIKMLKNVAANAPKQFGQQSPVVGEAEHMLGLCYQEGIGVKRDLVEAKRWYARACKHGSTFAANNLGLMYRSEGNLSKTEHYLKIAAKDGCPKVMVNLALLYLTLGIPEHSLEWCHRAKENDNFGAIREQVDEVENRCKALIAEFQEIGVIEWEKKNRKSIIGMHYLQRVARFEAEQDPQYALFWQGAEKFMRQAKQNNPITTCATIFDPDMLRNCARNSNYARELLNAQNVFFDAMANMAVVRRGVSKGQFPMDICERFIVDLASCAKIEFMMAQFPLETRMFEQARDLVDQLLVVNTPFHEDTCICYVVLNGLSSTESCITFLNECIRKYPKNVFFVRHRVSLLVLMNKFEDAIKDVHTSMNLEPFNYCNFYMLAEMMSNLSPRSIPNATIDMFNKFLADAPEDHRLFPEAHYKIAELLCDYLMTKKIGTVDISNVQHFYNLGLEAEKRQLPIFLPYESNTKAGVELVLNSFEIHRNKQWLAGASKLLGETTKTADAGRQKKQERVFRPELSDPHREKIIMDHRQFMAATSGISRSCRMVAINLTFKPPKVQKSRKNLAGLKVVTLHDMDHNKDRIYEGCVFSAMIIDEMSFASSVTTIVEDSTGDVLSCTFYNWPDMEDKAKTSETFRPGCKISIVNPYMRMAMDGNSIIRVDDPTSVVFNGYLEKICRYCCEENTGCACARCEKSYCDGVCQKLDWARGHKLVCVRNN